MRKVFLVSLAVVSIIFVSGVSAEGWVIENNGSGSTNGININKNSQKVIDQSNQSNVNNKVDASADTGGNSTNNGSGGSITTGNASVNVNITNDFNRNSATVKCCATPTPVSSPQPSPKPTPTPTPTPTSGRGDGGRGSGDGGGGSSGGGVGGAAVMGLSATSGEIEWRDLFYLGIGVCLVAARKLLVAGA